MKNFSPDQASLKPFLLIVGAKAYCLLILFVLFLKTGVREGDLGFLFQDIGQFRSERRAQIEGNFWERLTPFDGQWYQDIATRGYRNLSKVELADRNVPPGNFAFFPMLPGLIYVTRAIAPHHYLPLTILLLLYLSAFGAFYVWPIARQVGAPPVLSVILLLAFPTAVFQAMLYTEGIFLLLSSMTLFFSLQKKLLPSVACGILASLCRPQGVLLTLPLFVEFVLPYLKAYMGREFALGIFCSLAPLSGFVVMAAVSLAASGSPTAFLGIQSRWGRSYDAGGFLSALFSVFHYQGPPFDIIGLLIGVGLLPFLWKRLPKSLAAYGTGAVLLPLLTGSILSMGRFMSVSIPHFLCLAMLIQKRTFSSYVVVALFLVFQILIAKGVMGWFFVG